MGTHRVRVYWANAMFSEADRTFNARCTERLRASGFSVFLPQESTENASLTPSADSIFRQDSAEILRSDLVVACLDQETIDAGVACEIGLAYAAGIPVVGIYTDIRQDRTGTGLMYKNLYVVGALMNSEGIVRSVDGLLAALTDWSKRRTAAVLERAAQSVHRLSAAAAAYEPFVHLLESWYDPAWSSLHCAEDFVRRHRSHRVLEVGCGTGALAARLTTALRLSYVGLEKASGMLEVARARRLGGEVAFTDSAEVARAGGPYDTVILAFTLHDHPDPTSTVRFALESLALGGTVLVLDLSTSDLPALVRRLRQVLASPSHVPDTRFDPTAFFRIVQQAGGSVAKTTWHTTEVRFPTAADLDRYCDFFSIYDGCDLPLGLTTDRSSGAGDAVRRDMAHWYFPFVDVRCFAEAIVTR